MFQRWRSLLFLHFPCEPSEIAPLLPPGLSVDTFLDANGREMAWIGLVPFRMEGVRTRFLPPVPRLSAFPETNVRTYVHRDGGAPGVWFFSLDAANPLACRIARRFFSLPYHEATMTVHERENARRYESRRRSDGAGHTIAARFGEPLPPAEPGTLEFFLAERYLLYAQKLDGLFTGQVFHTPYPLRQATVESLSETLVEATGLSSRPFVHVLASDGVDVDIHPLRRVPKSF
ncbi:YqjF family protein [soil metagenome]